ncbi:hypothetical protein CLOSCI_00994 [[Clostridium] scindens ATCC 35704]|nr:hypothetical protein CLOSCI_00994 [[Clostridium] scindens ATCC 35704]
MKTGELGTVIIDKEKPGKFRQESIWKEYGLTERIREGLPPYNRQRLISEAARQDAGLSVGQKRFYQDAADPLAGGILVCEVIGPEHRGKYIGI